MYVMDGLNCDNEPVARQMLLMVGKVTTMGATAPWSFNDESVWMEVDCLEFFFPFLFGFGGEELHCEWVETCWEYR